MFKSLMTTSALLLSFWQAGPSHADAISPDTGIQLFSFGEAGSSLGELTFTLSKTATLTVTDLFISGDQFDITNFGMSLGATSKPTPGHDVGDDFGAALSDPYFSKATYILGPGSYDISGTVLQNAPGFTYGSGAYLLSTVPLPASAPMFGAALLALAGFGYGMTRRVAPKSEKAAAAA